MRPDRLVLALLALALPSAGLADTQHDHAGHDHARPETREHGAHVHGIGRLNIVLERNAVHIELDSPAANIVGFEHAAQTDADRAVLERALQTLRDGDRLFLFSPAAACQQVRVAVQSSMLESAHAHGEKHDHDHADKGGAGGSHDHADIRAEYQFECRDGGKVEQVVVELFEAFPATERLEVQYVIGSRQGAARLTAAQHLLRF